MQRDLQLANAKVDPETGFLEFPPDCRTGKSFNAQAKVKFLALFKESGDKGQAMDDTGFRLRILKTHLKADPVFNEAFQEVLEYMEARIEGNFYRNGLTGKGALMGFGWLKKNIGGNWGPNTKTDENKGKNQELEAILKKAIDITPQQEPS